MRHENVMTFLDFLKNNPEFLEVFGKDSSSACQAANLKLSSQELAIWEQMVRKLTMNTDQKSGVIFRPLL